MKSLAIITSFFLTIIITSCGSKNDSLESENSSPIEDLLKEDITPKSPLKICTELLPPPPPSIVMDYEMDTIKLLERQNKVQDAIAYTIIQPTPPYIASLSQYKWQTKNIKVTFLDGEPEVIQRVEFIAKQWEEVSGIRFTFGNFTDPDISISFLYEGSWSAIGSYSRKIRPSMNFGWLERETSLEEYNRVVLHEFGHALGFIHEHQQPSANINWNRPEVYKYYQTPPNNWEPNQIDANIFAKYNKTQTQNSVFDPSSIMIYAIPAELTLDGFSVDWNSTLSETDKAFVSLLYPIQ